ncbi:pilus assembly protein CpaE [Pseudolysinimonas sp.]|uniref:pilus assembly protein CpaE n=1 Tax=Pseudolysinimonas sp. TaxID=2680009 RepID=UPI003F810C6B
MISTALAQRLRDAGLHWAPVSGDVFQLAPGAGTGADGELEGDLFTVSDMTIEAHVYPTGTILGFNGTTEWALDSVALEDALWLPREDQLRDLLQSTFRSLDRLEGGGAVSYRVRVERAGEQREFASDDPAEAYGLAVLELVLASRD